MVFEDEATLATATASEIARLLAFAPGDRTDLGLAGGTTPRATYRELRALEVAWERLDLWLSDERWVASDHPDSNGRMAAEELADHVPATLHRPVFSDHLEPDESAAFYESDLRRVFPDGPRLVLLGMGADGHTASLFPGTAATQAEESRWFVANWIPRLESWRLTATAGLLRSASDVLVLVSGEAKASTLAAVLEGEPGRLPIQVLHTTTGSVTWMIDEAAASALRSTTLIRPG